MTDYYIRQQSNWYSNHEVFYIDDSHVNVWQPSNVGLDWNCYHLTQKMIVPQGDKIKHIKSLKTFHLIHKEFIVLLRIGVRFVLLRGAGGVSFVLLRGAGDEEDCIEDEGDVFDKSKSVS